ncbi:hypothetical protein [Psychroserpens luteolus]|uniref:hypothetical protein n=1 Tax=Psychroserpens luteolus TaxID=2855840 RepID=UPI001E2D3817|nr:hypothetical protein [Psychroserpens luteolus]MCD2258759.1 hypothetical protein [Psychroserpens luteolus]
MRTGKIQIRDNAKLSKALNRNNYILYIVIVIFAIINIDLFSSQPRFLVTEGLFWKGASIVFQVLFILSLVQWDVKKKKVISILSNGMIVKGQLIYSDVIKPNKTSSFNVHLFEYEASGKIYDIEFKNKSKQVKSSYIIYKINQPEKAIVYEDLKPNIKRMVQQYSNQ